LDSNYDPEEFVNFLKDDLQVEELDVSHMTMKSLECIVMKYKQYKFYQNDKKGEPTIVQPSVKKIKVDYVFHQTFRRKMGQSTIINSNRFAGASALNRFPRIWKYIFPTFRSNRLRDSSFPSAVEQKFGT
jgi:hypothetical protein